MNKKNFLPFKQQRTLGKSTLNEPAEVAMADVVNPIVDDQVDLQMAPGIYIYYVYQMFRL